MNKPLSSADERLVTCNLFPVSRPYGEMCGRSISFFTSIPVSLFGWRVALRIKKVVLIWE